MLNWREYYQKRIVSLQEAVGIVKSGDLIVDGHGFGRPTIFTKALLERAGELKNVRLTTGFTVGDADYCLPEYSDSFRHVSLFNVGYSRLPVQEGRADFVPLCFSQIERALCAWGPDILFTHVTPPDQNGYVSMGISVDFTRTAMEAAKTVIAQVNGNMPWTGGEAVVHISEIDCFVVEDTPIPLLPDSPNPSETDRAIASHIAELINDGDTLQLGVGSVPDMVLSLLENHRHLGIHSELGSTGIMKMVQKGVIDNSRKSLDKGKIICTLLGGTEEFYGFANHNPVLEMRRSSYVCNPMVIARQKNMCAINSAIQVDLYGQVCSDMMGSFQFSGIGGQNDFLRGAMMAEGGKSIICMPSTAKKGTASRIVPFLDRGAAVANTRYDVMYMVTEYGAAYMLGKSLTERAKALIDIAHPRFREELERDFYQVIRGK
jgi:4-hydroxybutyrate CoA-transferase